MIATSLVKLTRRLRGSAPKAVKFCVICRQPVDRFHPYRGGWSDAPRLMRLLDVVGSDLDNWSCPHCAAHDRERHLFLYMDRLGLLAALRGASVLHFAPEKRLARIVAAHQPVRYVRGDLYPTSPDIEKLDLLAIAFPDETFDFVIANHVLEHVSDDLLALREIRRVLRPGGRAILQTPYSARLKRTIEDAGIDDKASRLEIYGQEDHVRLYGQDIFERFSSAGLVGDVRRHQDALPDIEPLHHGVNRAEPLFLFGRP